MKKRVKVIVKIYNNDLGVLKRLLLNDHNFFTRNNMNRNQSIRFEIVGDKLYFGYIKSKHRDYFRRKRFFQLNKKNNIYYVEVEKISKLLTKWENASTQYFEEKKKWRKKENQRRKQVHQRNKLARKLKAKDRELRTL